MELLLDDPATEKTFRELLTRIRLMKNGETVDLMKKMGLNYRINWGASIISLRDLSRQYEKNHLLALKLWNKQWRETMIMATLLDDPALLSEEQMDYWTKSIETNELAEQAVMNLFVNSKFAFVKALEYCRGKKHLVRYTGLLMLGRLAMMDKKAIDEMFEPFFEVLLPLSKDPALSQIFYRTMVILINRSEELREVCAEFVAEMAEQEEEQAQLMAKLLQEEISAIEGDEVE